MTRLLLVIAAAIPLCLPLPAQVFRADLHGRVVDEDGHPVPRVEIAAHWGTVSALVVYTDAAGQFQIASLDAARVYLSFSKPGFFKIENQLVELTPGVNEPTFTMNHENELQQQIQVVSKPTQIDPDTTSHQETLVQHEILNIPVPSSHNLQTSLITMPNVMQDSSGTLHVAGARQEQTEILLDGFEINDPASGAFTSRVNIDTVQDVTVETGAFGAQYAHADAAVLSLDTTNGDDKWRFGTTNFFPGLSFKEGTHFGNWFPRVTFSGPLKKKRAWFSEALSLQRSFTIITGLPPGQNFTGQWVGDSLLRSQVILAPRNILQANFLYNRSSSPQFGLGPFTPLSTTTDQQSSRFFESLKDQIWLGRTLFDFGGAVDTDKDSSSPQGDAPYVIAPSTSSGNYFQNIGQRSRRIQLLGDVTTGSLHFLGTQTISAGWNWDWLDFSQQAVRNQIDFVRADGSVADQATFSGPAAFHVANIQAGAYAQDLWRPFKTIVISAAIRADWDHLIQQTLPQPRFAINWVPGNTGHTKLTISWGEHYQPLSLVTVGQGLDQRRVDTVYDSTGSAPLAEPVVSTFAIPHAGLSQPRSYNATFEFDQETFHGTFIGTAYILREGRDGPAWLNQPSGGFLLQSIREDRFVSGEVWAHHTFGDKADLFFDYARSRANSNAVFNPAVASLIFASQQSGPVAWDAPNRFLSRGWTSIPWWNLLLSYFLEYRSGFPFSAVNDQQQLVGFANSLRYPDYVSLNIGIEKRFHFHNHDWAFRISSINATDHNNPIAVVNDVDASNFRFFSGGEGRSFTARLRLVTQH